MERYIVCGVNSNGVSFTDNRMFKTVEKANKRCMKVIFNHLKDDMYEEEAKKYKTLTMEQFNEIVKKMEIDGCASLKTTRRDFGGLLCWFESSEYLEAQVCKVTGE